MKLILYLITAVVAFVIGLAVGIGIGISWDQPFDQIIANTNGSANSNVIANTNSVTANDCETDNDCQAAGCSKQLCVNAQQASSLVTTCEYRDYYKCTSYSQCGCTNNKCQWEQTSEYQNCLTEYGVRP